MSNLSIADVLRFMISEESGRIYQLKQDEIQTETAKKTIWTCDADKTKPVIDGRNATKEEFAAGYRAHRVEYRKVTRAMSPKSPTWAAYKGAKRQVSILLTARRIAKVKAGELVSPLPEAQEERLSYSIGLPHGGRKPVQMTRIARKYLHKLENRLEKQPERFAKAEKWAKEHPVQARQTAKA